MLFSSLVTWDRPTLVVLNDALWSDLKAAFRVFKNAPQHPVSMSGDGLEGNHIVYALANVASYGFCLFLKINLILICSSIPEHVPACGSALKDRDGTSFLPIQN